MKTILQFQIIESQHFSLRHSLQKKLRSSNVNVKYQTKYVGHQTVEVVKYTNTFMSLQILYLGIAMFSPATALEAGMCLIR